MPSIRKRNGLWQAQVRKRNTGSISKSFHRKSDATKWALQQEITLQSGSLISKQRFAKHMDTNAVSVHYLAAKDNERRLKSRVRAVFPNGVHHLTYHAVMSSQRPLPRGSEALRYINLK